MARAAARLSGHIGRGPEQPVGTVTFRLVFQHDLTYAIELTTADGKHSVIKNFAREADAEAWIEEKKGGAPADEVWVRRPLKNWRHN